MTSPIRQFLRNTHRRSEDEPVYHDAVLPNLRHPQFVRITDYRENLVNLITFYVSYVLMIASAVVVITFSLRDGSSFKQTFDVQGFPNVVFAWNADAAATALPTISAQGSGGQATCTPYSWSRGLRMGYDCTSLATDGRERLFFSLYSTTPFPATIKTYRNSRLRYSDVEVPTYFVGYSTHIPSTTASVDSALSTAAAMVRSTASGTSSPSPAQLAVAAVTPSPSALRPRQDGGAEQNTITAAPTSLPLRKLEYPTTSLSALAAGTIVSTMSTPSPSTTSIVVYSAKLKDSFYIYFIIAVAIPAVLASLTTLLVTYNLAVATKKVWPPEPWQTVTQAVVQYKESQARANTVPSKESQRKPASDLLVGRQDDASVTAEVPPPAYQKEDDSTAHVAAWFAERRASAIQDDAIEEASILAPSVGLNQIDTPVQDQDDIDAPSFDHVRVDPGTPLKARTDGRRLPLRLAWFILPSYTYLYVWDMLPFMVLLVLAIAAVGLAADGMLDVGTFVRSGGCLGEPADKGSVYSLQRNLCSNRKFLSAYPVIYSNPTTDTTLTRVAGDLLAVLIGLLILFLSYLSWIAALLRKSHLTNRDGMEPRDNNHGKRMTGKTRWRYFTVWNQVGTHGRPYADTTELDRSSRSITT